MIYLILYQVFVVWLAWNNKKRIENGKKIHHGLNGGIHILTAICVGFGCSWNFGVALLFLSRVVFDVSLNLFRGLGVGYISPSPSSKVDKIEKWVVKWLAEKVFIHDPASEAMEKGALVIKVCLLVKTVTLCVL